MADRRDLIGKLRRLAADPAASPHERATATQKADAMQAELPAPQYVPPSPPLWPPEDGARYTPPGHTFVWDVSVRTGGSGVTFTVGGIDLSDLIRSGGMRIVFEEEYPGA